MNGPSIELMYEQIYIDAKQVRAGMNRVPERATLPPVRYPSRIMQDENPCELRGSTYAPLFVSDFDTRRVVPEHQDG